MQPAFTPITVDAPQRSDAWYAARLGNVTASRAADTMSYYAVAAAQLKQAHQIYLDGAEEGMTDEYAEHIQIMSEQYPTEFCLQVGIELVESAARKGYKQTLVAERITRMRGDTDPYISEDMKWGIINEGIAISLYQMQYKMITKRSPLYLHPTLLCGASPDSDVEEVLTGEQGNAEVKCLRSANHLYKVIKEDEVPKEYLPQILMQMWIRQVWWCDFVAYDSRVAEGLRIFVKRVAYDEFYINNVLEPAVRRFLEECDHDERVFAAIRKRNLEHLQQEADDIAERAILNNQPEQEK